MKHSLVISAALSGLLAGAAHADVKQSPENMPPAAQKDKKGDKKDKEKKEDKEKKGNRDKADKHACKGKDGCKGKGGCGTK